MMQELPGLTPKIGVEKTRIRTPKPAPKTRLMSLYDLDKRTAAARYAFDLRDNVVRDLGGEGALSAIKLEMASSLAVMSAMISDASARFLRGEQVDPGSVATLVNSRNRTAQILGMDRAMVDVNDLDTYIAGKA